MNGERWLGTFDVKWQYYPLFVVWLMIIDNHDYSLIIRVIFSVVSCLFYFNCNAHFGIIYFYFYYTYFYLTDLIGAELKPSNIIFVAVFID